jgi:hypothetical protein
MKSRSRLFQVEVRRAKGHSRLQASRSNVALLHRRPGTVVGNSRERVDPFTVPAAAIYAIGPGSASPGPVEVAQPRRVLPDLRPTIITQSEERGSDTRPARRPKQKVGKRQYAAMRALDQDEERNTSEPLGTDSSPGDQNQNGNSDTSAPQEGAIVPPSAQTASPTRGLAEAALRSSGRAKQGARVPRWERWKERRLPRVCWGKPSRSTR